MMQNNSRYHGYLNMPDEPSPAQRAVYEHKKATEYAVRIATDTQFASSEADVRKTRDEYFLPMREELKNLTSHGRTRRREAKAICDKYIKQDQ